MFTAKSIFCSFYRKNNAFYPCADSRFNADNHLCRNNHAVVQMAETADRSRLHTGRNFCRAFFNFVPTVSDNENLTLWADIGVIFLLFGLGLEFSFKKMISVGKSAMITALLNIVLMLFAGFYTGKLLGWPVMDCFFLGSMISMSSTTIIIKAFDDLNVKSNALPTWFSVFWWLRTSLAFCCWFCFP